MNFLTLALAFVMISTTAFAAAGSSVEEWSCSRPSENPDGPVKGFQMNISKEGARSYKATLIRFVMSAE